MDSGKDIVGVAGVQVPFCEVDQDDLIATKKWRRLGLVDPLTAIAEISTAAAAVPGMAQYLSSAFVMAGRPQSLLQQLNKDASPSLTPGHFQTD
jgi:hypothetical protein